MIEKLKKNFKEKKIENLITFLIILVVTLIIINNILKDDKNVRDENSSNTIQLVTSEKSNIEEETLEIRLEKILSQLEGVGEVDVLITYSQTSSINPLYNENTSTSTTRDNSSENNSKITETQSISKEILTDNNLNPIIQTTVSPKVEGAVVIAKGASNTAIKANIISAIEATTGVASHKIQVFTMK